jgi:hypothetical protein
MMANILGPIGELAKWAQLYAEQGLEVFPLKPDKSPYTSFGFKDASTDPAVIAEWWQRWPNALIGHRIAADVLVLDVDPRHGGNATLAALKAEALALGVTWPTTRAHRSGRDDGGGHVWWLRPDDDANLSTLKLDAWAKERGVGEELANPGEAPRWTGGIDLLHRDLRYTILPPSPHQLTGKSYAWSEGRGLDLAPAPLPSFVADLLEAPDRPLYVAPPPRVRVSGADATPADWYTDTANWRDVLEPHGWHVVAGDGDTDRSRWRHPTATSALSATISNGYLCVFSTSTVFRPTVSGDVKGYTRFEAHAMLAFGGDQSAAASAVRKSMPDFVAHVDPFEGLLPVGPVVRGVMGATTPPPPTTTGLVALPLGTNGQATLPAVEDRAGLYLPATLWTARPVLQHIHDAARSRQMSPDAVLAAVLCRVAACSPHILEIPAFVAVTCGLTFYAALVGPPSGGKSGASGVAAALLPAPAGVVDRVPIGSGEGMIEILFDLVTEPDPDTGKPVKVKRQKRHAAIFHVDEVKTLTALAARAGSTIMQTICSAWTHGKLGQANAAIENRRELEGGSYVYGMTVGVQAEEAKPLLIEHATSGTPQRFLWLMGNIEPGSHLRGVEWPGPLDWRPVDAHVALTSHGSVANGFQRGQLGFDPVIWHEVVEARIESSSATFIAVDDQHAMLLRLKVAALLALLDDRLDVDLIDWDIARVIVATNQAVRAGVRKTLDGLDIEKAKSRTRAKAMETTTLDAHHRLTTLAQAAAKAGRSVERHAVAGATERHALDVGCTRACITLAVSSRDRQEVTVDEVIDHALQHGLMHAVDGRYRPPVEA